MKRITLFYFGSGSKTAWKLAARSRRKWDSARARYQSWRRKRKKQGGSRKQAENINCSKSEMEKRKAASFPIFEQFRLRTVSRFCQEETKTVAWRSEERRV